MAGFREIIFSKPCFIKIVDKNGPKIKLGHYKWNRPTKKYRGPLSKTAPFKTVYYIYENGVDRRVAGGPVFLPEQLVHDI